MVVAQTELGLKILKQIDITVPLPEEAVIPEAIIEEIENIPTTKEVHEVPDKIKEFAK